MSIIVSPLEDAKEVESLVLADMELGSTSDNVIEGSWRPL